MTLAFRKTLWEQERDQEIDAHWRTVSRLEAEITRHMERIKQLEQEEFRDALAEYDERQREDA